MRKIKLFLASSSELKSDREQFEIFIYRRCKLWFDQGIFLHLDIWEDFLDAMSPGGLQSEYNKAIKDCDIFVLLAFNKVGLYTAEEFGEAFGQFSANRKPFIFTYFKPPTTRDRDQLQSLWAFEDKLKELKHYKTTYDTIEGLREHFGNQLDKLAANDFSALALAPDNSGSPESTASAPKNDLRGANFGGGFAETVYGNNIGQQTTTIKTNTIGIANTGSGTVSHFKQDLSTPESQRILTEVAAEIGALLKQLEQTNAMNTLSEKMALAGTTVAQIENNPHLKGKAIAALVAAGAKALEEAIDHPVATFVVRAIEEWKSK